MKRMSAMGELPWARARDSREQKMSRVGIGAVLTAASAASRQAIITRTRAMTAPQPSPPGTPAETIGLLVEAGPGPGVLHQLSGVIARHGVDITLVEILENRPAGSRTYFEVVVPAGAGALEQDLAALAGGATGAAG